MAKAKKETKPKAAEKKTAAGKPAAAPARTLDTSHVAEAAAARVASGLGGTPLPAAGGKESSTFKHLKESLNKPASGMGVALDKSGLAGGKHSHLPFGHAGKQVGRNQTFGADVNRTGVPRRTGG
ncbi:MAG TPA: hypothetical protein VMD30_14185 [Tepidisphaeraceae bacterium]|nr:hypothetical protein [Tepidisphaeraceae bacterium]